MEFNMKKTWFILFGFAIILALNNYYQRIAYSSNTNVKLHITIIGSKDEKSAQNLYNTAIKSAPKNSLIQWWSLDEAKRLNPSMKYPDLKQAAAYICIQYRCSLPALTPAELQVLIKHFTSLSQVSTEAIPTAAAHSNESISNPSETERILRTSSWWLIVPIFWFFGLLLSITPCVLPLILIITSILGASSEALTKKQAFLLSLTYIISLASTYAVAGIVVANFGLYLQAYMQNSWVLGFFSLVFLLLGISLFGFFSLAFPFRWRKAISTYSKKFKAGSYVGVAIMGVLATLIASPCVAAPLAGILAYVATSGDIKFGGIALFFVGLGIGTPILLINTIGIELLQKLGAWQKYIKQFFGLLLLGISIWLIERIVPAKVVMLLWASLAIFSAIYMGAIEKQLPYPKSSSMRNKSLARLMGTLSKMISIMILVYGCAILVGALIGNTNPLSPLEHKTSSESSNVISLSSFQHVKNLSELQHSLEAAHKPVIVFFTAEWCTACKEIENDTLPDSNVQKLLNNFTLLYVNLTDIHSEDIILAKHLHVFGPPVILFFNKTNLISNTRIDGVVSSEKLSSELKSILDAAHF